jgi:hypothetical protein
MSLTNSPVGRPGPKNIPASVTFHGPYFPDLELAKLLEEPSRYWGAPFRYEPEGTMIVDANGDRILDVRGWGHLTGKGAHGLPDSDAERIQDALGNAVAKILNANWPK